MICHMQELLLPLAAHLSYLPQMNVRVEGLCTQYLLLPLINFDDIWNTYISGQVLICHMQKWLLTPCYTIGLSPLNELFRGKLVSSLIANIPYCYHLV